MNKKWSMRSFLAIALGATYTVSLQANIAIAYLGTLGIINLFKQLNFSLFLHPIISYAKTNITLFCLNALAAINSLKLFGFTLIPASLLPKDGLIFFATFAIILWKGIIIKIWTPQWSLHKSLIASVCMNFASTFALITLIVLSTTQIGLCFSSCSYGPLLVSLIVLPSFFISNFTERWTLRLFRFFRTKEERKQIARIIWYNNAALHLLTAILLIKM